MLCRRKKLSGVERNLRILVIENLPWSREFQRFPLEMDLDGSSVERNIKSSKPSHSPKKMKERTIQNRHNRKTTVSRLCQEQKLRT